MVVVRNKMIWTVPTCGIFAIFPLIHMIDCIFNPHKFSFDWLFFLDIIIFLTFMTLMLSFAPNFKIILNDYGITIKNEMNFLFFTIYKKSTTKFWGEVEEVDYWDISYGTMGGSFVFAYIEKKQINFLRMHFMLNNRKEALEYAVKKLPNDIFTKEAQTKLRKMGIN